MKTRLFRTKYLILLIMTVATFLRLWKLGSIPPHLTQDEASFGYNAYSILKTGKDIHGATLPLIFKSFGDFRPGLYFYLLIPFIGTFGLNELSVRLPNAIAGVAAVYLIYKTVSIIQSIVAKRDENNTKLSNDFLPFASAFLLAVSPWHIILSRGAWEANVSLTLTLLGIYFFYRSFKRQKYLVLSFLFFGLTPLTYQGAKLATAIVLIILTFLYWKRLRTYKINVLFVALIVGLVVCAPILLSLFQGKAGRLEVLSIFSYRRSEGSLSQQLIQGNESVGSLSYYVFHSETLNFVRAILGRWFNHFSGRFLFFEGDWENPRHSVPNHGMLLLSDLVLLILGLYEILKKNLSKEKLFVLLWLILAPLPAILTRDQVHAVRAYNMIIPLVVISGVGLSKILIIIRDSKKPAFRTLLSLSLVVIFAIVEIYFLDSYFVHLPKHNSKYWLYGYKQVTQEIIPVQDIYKKILFQQSYDQPFIFFLFYGAAQKDSRYDPEIVQKQLVFEENIYGDVGLVERLGNIYFVNFSWPPPAEPGDLVVGDNISTLAGGEDESFKLISEIKYPDGNVAFRILEKI